MAKTDAERGPFGAWLVKQRKSRAGSGRDGTMTAAEVRQALVKERSYMIGESAYAELESGTRLPTDEQRRHLEGWAGESGPASHGAAPSTGDNAAIVAAIEEQTRAIHAQTAMLEQVLLLIGGVREPAPDIEAVTRKAGLLPRPDAAPASTR